MLRIARRLAFLLVLLPGLPALAQIPGLSTKAEPPASSQAEPATVPIAEIPFRADADDNLIQEALKRSISPERTAALVEELALLERNVGELATKTQPARLATLPISNLETLDRYIAFLDRELRQWQAELQAAAKPVSSAAAELVQMRKLWAGTRAALAGDDVPALEQRIDALLKEVVEAEKAIAEPLSRLLALSRDGTRLQFQLAKATTAVQGQIGSVDRKLWQRESPHLVAALADASPAQHVDAAALLAELADQARFVRELDRPSSATARWILVVVALSLPLFLRLSTRAKLAFASHPGLQPHRRALTRPVSAWLLLGLGVLILVQILGPTTQLKGLLLLAWLPMMRLQPEHVRQLLGRWIYVVGLFVLLNVASYLLTASPLLFRLVVLLNGVLMLVVGVILLPRIARAGPGRPQRVVRALLGAGAAAVVVSLLANLVGNVTLAAMLTEAVVVSVYVALFSLAAGSVVRSWARFVFGATTQRLLAQTGRAGGLLDVGSRLFDLALVLAWAYGTLYALRLLRPLQDAVVQASALTIGFGSISMTLGGIVLFAVSVYLSFWIAKTVRGVLSEDVLPRMVLPRGVANSVSTMSYYLLLMAGLVVALAAAGFQISQLAIVLGALSLGVGFGLQTVVNNFVSGLILMFERPIQPGDTVELSGTVGTVREIGMRATTFTTFDGADVVVPNGMLLSEKLINWTLSSNTRRIDVPVGVAYGSDPEQVRALLLKVTEGAEGVARQPPPSVLFTGFGASSLDFSVRAWSLYNDSPFVRSKLAISLHDALRAAGIEIPFPQQDLHLRSVDAELLSRLRGSRPGAS
jgi:small-conductance mechanosensitive channel